ncbi:MAG: TonB-dependent receptor [Acidobacteria bacterium]|nr:TonB-dependent receptor [Acidobacteriota bacterium]
MNANWKKYRVLWAVLLVCLVQTAFAQVRSGTITGTITDSSGAVVPGADVTARDEATNVEYNGKTTQAGQFTIPYLAAGTYTVTISKGGFQKFSATGVPLAASQTVRVDGTLSIGTATEQVEVQASGAQIQTESSTISSAISAQVIDAIPNITQNPLYFATLQNGVQPRNQNASSQNTNSFGIGVAGRAQYSSIGVNGGRAFENDIQVDGLPNTGFGFNEAAVVPNQEGIQEVRVISNNFTADYGRGMSVLAINTKSGGNQFHGQASYLIRNEALNANTPGNKIQTPLVRRPAFKVNDMGGALSGPILRDKLFFSSSFHYQRFNSGQTNLLTVPTALERVGDFSQTFINDAGNPVPAQLFDPYNVTQLAPDVYQRNIIPGAKIANPNPAALLMYSFYPQPNRTPDDKYNTNNYTSYVINTVRKQTLNTRIDYKLGKHSIYSSGGYDFGTITQPRPFGTAPFNDAPSQTKDSNFYAQLGDTMVVNPTLYVDVRYGVTRINTFSLGGNQSGFTKYNDFGIAPATQALFAAVGSAPVVNPNGFGGGSGGGSNWAGLSSGQFANKRESQIAHAINGSVTKVSGNWTYKAGAEYRVMLANFTDFEEGSANLGGCCAGDPGGNYSFQFVNASGGSIASRNATASQRGINAAAMLLGQGVWFVRPGANLKPAYAAKYFAVYTQNDWKPKSNLTFNLGLRWDVQPGITERYNRMTAVDLTKKNPFGTQGVFAFPGVNGYSRGLWDTEYHDFQPRVGVAWQVYPGTVIRGGFGITYLPTNSGYFSSSNDYGGAPFAAGNQALPYGSTPNGVPVTRSSDAAPIVAAVGANQAAPQIYGTGTTYFDRHLKNQVAKQGNLFVEQAFGKGQQWIMSVGWSGSFSNNLTTRSQPIQNVQSLDPAVLSSWRSQYIANNGANPATAQVNNPFQGGSTLIPFQGGLSGRTIQQQIPLMPYPLLWGATLDGSRGYGSYNSLQARVTHSFSSGLNLALNYTWSKELDYVTTPIEDGQGVNSGGTVGTPDLVNNGLNRNYGLADVPHRFVATVVYTSPFGKNGKHALVNPVARFALGGWSLGSVVSMQGGMPVVVSMNNGAFTSRVDRVPGVPIQVPTALQKRYDGATPVTLPCGKTVTPGKYQLLKYNACAFSGRTVTGQNGNPLQDIYWIGNHAQTNGDMRGLARYNVDLSLRRAFPIYERYRFEISGEATNVLNNTQWNGSFVGNLGSTTLATDLSKGRIQGLGDNTSFGTLNTNAFDPRQIQLHARFIF